MFTLLKKETSGFLNSLIGYVVIGVFLLINALFLWVFPLEFNILDYGYANLDGLFLLAPFVFLFLIPAITMRSFADEKKTGTIELLLTKPLTDLQIILRQIFCRSDTCFNITIAHISIFCDSLRDGLTSGKY